MVGKSLIVAAVTAVATLAIAGCGGSSNTTPTTTPAVPAATTSQTTSATTSPGMTKKEAGKAYLAAIAPANEAIKAFGKKAESWTNSTTGSQAAGDATPLNDALTALRPKLLTLATDYPAAATDLKALVTAYAPLQGDLENLVAVNQLNAASWLQAFTQHASATEAASAIVRSDLGLPPRPTSVD
jgi:hypothetical protein